MIGQVMGGGGLWGVYETAKLQKVLGKTAKLHFFFFKIPILRQKFRENIYKDYDIQAIYFKVDKYLQNKSR